MNIETGKWDSSLCEAFGISMGMLPVIVRGNQNSIGSICKGSFSGIPIGRIIADQQASLYAQSEGGKLGILKCTYGTGCFLMQNTGKKAVFAQDLITTVAFERENCLHYALEAYIPFGAGELNSLVEEGGFGSVNEIDALISSKKESSFKQKATQFYMFLCEHVSEQVKLFQKALGTPFEFRVDGGLTNSNILMQMQANKLGFPLLRRRQRQATSVGAAGYTNQGEFETFWPHTE
jgi:glycerol kinase